MEKKIVSYKSLKKIITSDNLDPLVVLNNYYPSGIVCQYEKTDMFAWSGKFIIIREYIAKLLKKAAIKLQKIDKNYKFKIVYGYRHPTIQKKYFLKQKIYLAKKYNLSGLDLILLTHNFVASPDVAGHVCGAAIDLTILKNNKPIDMGTKIAEFTKPELIPTFSEKINDIQRKNRLLLRSLLLNLGFAPFNGEWWHFSYGDREWAYYYNKKKAIYSPLVLTKKELFNIINK